MTVRIASSLPAALRRPTLGALFVALALSACGGGGGSDATTAQPAPPPPPVVTNPQPEPTVPPPVASSAGVSLLAGSIGGAGNLDGTGANARFNSPSGLALDSAGDLVVADSGNHRIRKVTRSGVVTTLAGTGQPGHVNGPRLQAALCIPADVAVDAGGNVFVLEKALLRKIAVDGSVTTVAGATSADCRDAFGMVAPKDPRAVAVDALGIVYIADSFGGAVYTLTPSGVQSLLAGSEVRGQPTRELGSYPTGIALDAARNVYVSGLYGTVAKITPSGQLSQLLPSSADLGSPRAIASDAAGNLYLAYADRNVVRKVTTAGAVSIIAGLKNEFNLDASIDGPLGTGRLSRPNGIAVAADGTVFVSEQGGHTIRQIDPVSGNLSTLAGSALPRDMPFGKYHATDATGNVFVAVKTGSPVGDYAVQRIAPDGTVTTRIAGGLLGPRGIAIDKTGNVYVVDLSSQNDRNPCFGCVAASTRNTVVRRITPEGVMTILAGTLDLFVAASTDGTGNAATLPDASDLAIDGAGNLYVVQVTAPFSALRKITPDGTVSTLSGSGLPEGLQSIAVDAAGTLFVGVCKKPLSYYSGPVDTPVRSAVFKIDPSGKATLLAGSLTEIGFQDGVGTQARLSGAVHTGPCLHGLTLDAAGNVYVADTDNHAVRKITPHGNVSTVVGQKGVYGIALRPLPASLFQPTDVSVDERGNLVIGSVDALLKVRFDK